MDLDQAKAYGSVGVVSQAVKAVRRQMGEGHAHHHGAGVRTLRSADHKGHRIEVITTYEIQVDGRRLEVMLMVDNEGRVSCHAVPNYISFSAMDVVKRLIDAYPDSFPSSSEPTV
jgi:hypothetical protein